MEVNVHVNSGSTIAEDISLNGPETQNENSLVNENKPNTREWIRLNIGGQCFVTTKTTLCKNPHSFFYKLCQDDPSIGLTTDKVSIVISRNEALSITSNACAI
jgi:hypothetical protein